LWRKRGLAGTLEGNNEGGAALGSAVPGAAELDVGDKNTAAGETAGSGVEERSTGVELGEVSVFDAAARESVLEPEAAEGS
jgi:hypothetical protein